MSKAWIWWLWGSAGFLLPFLAFGLTALGARALNLWIGWRWYWDYLAVVILFSTLSWAGELLLNEIAVATLPARAQQVAHEWKAVPGRPDVLVDMASIRPSRPHGLPSGVGVTWDTEVTVSVNGHPFPHSPVNCEPGAHPYPMDGAMFDSQGHMIGSTPDAKIWAMVCPVRHPSRAGQFKL